MNLLEFPRPMLPTVASMSWTAVVPHLESRALLPRVKGIPLTARHNVSPTPVPVGEIAGSAFSSFHLSTACGHEKCINIYLQVNKV